jgi:Mn2+/Fe2+ NRAMP family transporter
MRGGLIAAIFLMATSAIGPGFITQTATFTAKLGAAFAFAILASVLIDFVVQMNIWRITALTGRRAAETANAAVPGAGYLLSVLVLFGGLVFNIGNIAGAGLGLNAVFGLDPKIGGAVSALIAIGIFLSRRAGLLLDRTIVWLGLVMIGLTILVAALSNPPVGEALRQTVMPAVVDFPAIITIVGGTVGGYITYAGAHRLLDKGLTGEANLASITRGALSGIAVTGLMRFILFLAILGVTASGVSIDVASKTANPAAQAFQAAAGDWGMRIFGVIFWAAAITSVIGAAYTSVSFLTVFRAMDDRGRNVATVIFIALSLAIFLALGSPPALLLVFAGGFNGLILPIGLTLFTWIGFARSDLMGGHHYSRPLLALSAIVCLLTWYMGISSVGTIFAMLG